ncbi:hypothetical protein HYC85_008444 [Camellia sinensis]|uniref:Uncharacterized protein n=1 Tax=Camellia sinensis TaxID=4442 RepID=A0A7J7HUA3_CAMSI|nr:hypothetical protein HYC85_008444 [Camellia sinensis]
MQCDFPSLYKPPPNQIANPILPLLFNFQKKKKLSPSPPTSYNCKTKSMATEDHDRKLNMIFLPYFVTSHLILLVDIASLFATCGLNATIITTPSNALLF